jgi:hypothetical protein
VVAPARALRGVVIIIAAEFVLADAVSSLADREIVPSSGSGIRVQNPVPRRTP